MGGLVINIKCNISWMKNILTWMITTKKRLFKGNISLEKNKFNDNIKLNGCRIYKHAICLCNLQENGTGVK